MTKEEVKNTEITIKTDEDKNRDKDIDRAFILDGSVNEESIRKISENILKVIVHDENEKLKDKSYLPNPIKLIINTYGGNVYDANMLIGIIETSETPVHTYCYGKAMSAGLHIFASGHKRFATPLATFMYHDVSGGALDTVYGLRYKLEQMNQLAEKYHEYILTVTDLPREMLNMKISKKEDWHMFADEALKYGLVDEIIPFRKRQAK